MDIRNYLFGGTTRQLVYKSMDASALRARVVAQNLANVDTPGYKRKEVSFEDQLQDLIKKKVQGAATQEDHMPFGKGVDISSVAPKVFEAPDLTLPGEINNVDVDMEAAKMAENQILYNYAIRFGGFDKYMSAIAGRVQS
jgi:flagellar basal-body rod protein FlgB